MFADVWTPIALDFLERYPTPSSAARMGQARMAAFLTKNGYSGRRPACGATPVTKKSGKHEAVHFRWACNKRFRNAMCTFADNSRRASPWAQSIYQAALDRGCDHPHAVRILTRAWIRVIYRCWADHASYDPARHGDIARQASGQSTTEAA